MKILTPDFERLNVETDAVPQPLEVSDNAIQAIARLFVYDTKARLWTPLAAEGGKLEVLPEGAYTTTFFATTIGATDVLTLNVEPSRRQVIVKNTGAAMLYIAKQTPITASTRFPLAPGESVTLVRYVDALYAVSANSTTISIIESLAS